MANFEAFHRVISSSINLLFLKSEVCMQLFSTLIFYTNVRENKKILSFSTLCEKVCPHLGIHKVFFKKCQQVYDSILFKKEVLVRHIILHDEIFQAYHQGKHEISLIVIKHTKLQKEYYLVTIFYTEILMRKVDLTSFFPSETSEKVHKPTFQVKISVQNTLFLHECKRKQNILLDFFFIMQKNTYFIMY